MNSIPVNLKEQLTNDPFMKVCIRTGKPNPTWEHAFTYAGKQIQERWAIVPVLREYNNDAHGFNKWFNQITALFRLSMASKEYRAEMADKYPKLDIRAEFDKLLASDPRFDNFMYENKQLAARLFKYRIE